MRKLMSDDDKVKAKLVAMIERAGDKDYNTVALLAREYFRFRAAELKADEGDWGDDLVTPTDSLNVAQVRS
jgi:hypothetical protein